MYKKLLIILFIAVCCFLILKTIDGARPVSEDIAVYALLAQSLVSGQGYSDLCYSGNPVHTKYPFVLPLILMPLITNFGYNFLIMRLLMFLFAVGIIIFSYVLFRRQSSGLPELVVLFVAFSSWFLYYTYNLAIDIPYLFFSLAALYYLDKYFKHSTQVGLYLSFIFIVLAFYTKVTGIALIAALAVYAAVHRKYVKLNKVIILLASVSLVCALWFIRSKYLESSNSGVFNSYSKEFFAVTDFFTYEKHDGSLLGTLKIVVKNIYALMFYAFPQCLTGLTIDKRNYLAVIPGIIVLMGFIKAVKQKIGIIEIYFITYIAMLMLWAAFAKAGTRYIVGILPFVFYYFLTGINMIVWNKRKIAASICALFITVNAILSFNYAFRQNKVNNSEFLTMCGWIKDNTPENAVFASESMQYWLYMYSGRKSALQIPVTRDTSLVYDIIKSNNIKYLTVSPEFMLSYDVIEPVIRKNANKFKAVYNTNGNIVYKVL